MTDTTPPPHLDLDSGIDAWIDAVFAALGLSRDQDAARQRERRLIEDIRRPYAAAADRARAALDAALQARLGDGAGEVELRREANALIRAARELDALRRIPVADLSEEELGERTQQIAAREARLDGLEQDVRTLDRAVATLAGLRAADMEAAVQRQQVEAACAALAEQPVVPLVGDGATEAFRRRHVELQRRVERARAMRLELETMRLGHGVTRGFAGLGEDAYRLLIAHLEMALRLLDGGDLGAANAELDTAEARLERHANARTGVRDRPAPVLAGLPGIEGLRSVADRNVEVLLDARLTAVGTGFRETLHDLNDQARALDALPEDQRPPVREATLAQLYRTLVEQTGEAVGGVARLRAIMGAAADMVRQIPPDVTAPLGRVRDDPDRRPFRDRAEAAHAAAAARLPGQATVPGAIDDADAMRLQVQQLLERSKTAALEAASIDRKVIVQEVDRLKERLDAFFRHHGDGTVRTKTDKDTRQAVPRRANHAIPRETLTELQTRIGAVEMIVDSDSVETLKRAPERIAEVMRFLDWLESVDEPYKQIEADLKKAEKRLAQLEDYSDYEEAEQAHMRGRFAELKKTCKTADPAGMEARVAQFADAVRAFRDDLKRLRTDYHANKDRLDAVGKTLGRLGKALQDYTKAFPEDQRIQGYHGDLQRRLQQLAELNGRKTRRAVDMARDHIGLLAAEAEQRLGIVVDFVEAPPEQGNRPEFDAVYADARAGQAERNRELAGKGDFEAAARTLKERLEADIGWYRSRKEDVTEREALKKRLGILEKEVKATRAYATRMPDLQALVHEYARFDADIDPRRFRSANPVIQKVLDVLPARSADLASQAAFCVAAVRGLAERTGALQDLVGAAGQNGAGNDLDPHRQAMQPFFAQLATAVRAGQGDALATAIAGLGDQNATHDLHRAAREQALSAIRELLAAVRGDPALRAYADNPFDDAGRIELTKLEMGLPALELAVLRART